VDLVLGDCDCHAIDVRQRHRPVSGAMAPAGRE